MTYGASLWCDPYRWIPEAARLLGPRGDQVFMRSTDLEMVCSADNEHIGMQLTRPHKGMHRLESSRATEGERYESVMDGCCVC